MEYGYYGKSSDRKSLFSLSLGISKAGKPRGLGQQCQQLKKNNSLLQKEQKCIIGAFFKTVVLLGLGAAVETKCFILLSCCYVL